MRCTVLLALSFLLVVFLTTGCPEQNSTIGNAACLGCHNGVNAPDMTGFDKSPHNFLTCETCHGPGYQHARNNGVGLIVVPTRGTKETAHMFCGACHPAEDADYVKSAHWTNPYETVGCTECHDPHAEDAERNSNADNSMCLRCHAPYGFATQTDITNHTGHSYLPTTIGTSRCSICHMIPQADRIPNHSFIPIPPQTANDQIAAGQTPTPTSCAGLIGCHDGTVPDAPIFPLDNTVTNAFLQTIYDARYGQAATE